jgi:hypothetical protein
METTDAISRGAKAVALPSAAGESLFTSGDIPAVQSPDRFLSWINPQNR